MQNVPLAKGDVAIEPFFDATQEMLSGEASNFRVIPISNTSIRVVAGTGEDQASISVDGFYRYRTTNGDAAHPGGAAGTYDIWVTASANDFTGADPNIDLTNYVFTPTIRAQGSPPTGVAHMRKIGEVVWDGAKITRLVQHVTPGRRDGDTLFLQPPLAHMEALVLRNAASQSGDIFRHESSSGSPLATINQNGALWTSSTLTADGVGGLTLTGAGGKDTIALTSAGAQTGITFGGDTALWRETGSVLRTGGRFDVERSSASSLAFTSRLDGGEAQPRWSVQAGGTMEWGPGGSTAPDVSLYRHAADTLRLDDLLYLSRAAGGDLALTARVGAEANPRFQVAASGGLSWGPGGATAPDVNLYRVAANRLATDDQFDVIRGAVGDRALTATVTGDTDFRFQVSAAGVLSWGTGIAAPTVTLYRGGDDVLTTDDRFTVRRTATGDLAHVIRLDADSDSRYQVTAGGVLSWGSGVAAPDTNLYRAAADVLATDDTLRTVRAAGSSSFQSLLLAGDANPAFRILGSGELGWGSGGATAVDTTLGRDIAGQLVTGALRTTGQVEIDGNLNHDGTNVGFFGVAPVARQAATTDLKDALTNYGLLQGTSAMPLNLDGGAITVGAITATGNINLGDADTDLIGFYSVSGVARPTATADIKDSLQAVGLLSAAVGATPLNLDDGVLTAGRGVFGVGPIAIQGLQNGDILAGGTTLGTFQYDQSGCLLYLQRDDLSSAGVHINVRKSRGAPGAPVAVAAGDDLLLIRAYGYGGPTGGFTEAARIHMELDGTVGDDRTPGRIEFHTASNAQPSVLTERMNINSAGLVHVLGAFQATGDATFVGALDHNGTEIGFFGIAPVARAGAAADLKDALVSYGLLTGGGATPLNLDDGMLTAGALTISGAVGLGGILTAARVVVPATGNAAYRAEQIAANSVLVNHLLTADVQPAFRVLGDGDIEWGPGGATAPDTNLYREAADVLATDDKLHVVGELEVDGHLNHDGTNVGFFGIAPAARAAATADIKDALTTYGLLQGTSASPLNLDGGLLTAGALTATGNVRLGDADTDTVGFFSIAGAARQSATTDIKDALTAYGLLQGTSASPLNLDGGALTSGALTATGNVRLGDADTDTLGFFSVAGAARAGASTDIKDALTSYGLLQGTSAAPLNLDGGTLTAGQVLVPANASSPALRTEQVAAERVLINMLLAADAQPAFRINGDGKHEWGPGGATVPDANLYRVSTAQLSTDGQLNIGTHLTVGGTFDVDGNALVGGDLQHVGDGIVFFNAGAPVGQQARPTTLNQLIDHMVAWGFFSP